jgi:hypothetical protein
MPEIFIDWEALDDRAESPLKRARDAMALLEQIPDIQSRLAQVRSNAIAELRERTSAVETASLLGITPARVGQLIGDGGRPDGIRLGLLKKGLQLALEHGELLPGDDRKAMQALDALSRPGRRTETEARGVATRLATVRGSSLDWDAMTDTDRQTLRRALAHAEDVRRGT